MRIAVLGGGHGCYAAAAELSEQGHEVWFWRRDSGDFAAVLDGGVIRLRDARGLRDVRIAHPTVSLEEAIGAAEAVVIPLPATAHDGLAEAAAPFSSTEAAQEAGCRSSSADRARSADGDRPRDAIRTATS